MHISDHSTAALARKRVVLESPCAPTATSSIDDHKRYLGRALLDSLTLGEAPIASHGLFAFSNVLDDNNPLHRQMGMHAGWAWIVASEGLVVYRDYGLTNGMEKAIAFATLHGVPVHYRLIGKNDADAPRDESAPQ